MNLGRRIKNMEDVLARGCANPTIRDYGKSKKCLILLIFSNFHDHLTLYYSVMYLQYYICCPIITIWILSSSFVQIDELNSCNGVFKLKIHNFWWLRYVGDTNDLCYGEVLGIHPLYLHISYLLWSSLHIETIEGCY